MSLVCRAGSLLWFWWEFPFIILHWPPVFCQVLTDNHLLISWFLFVCFEPEDLPLAYLPSGHTLVFCLSFCMAVSHPPARMPTTSWTSACSWLRPLYLHLASTVYLICSNVSLDKIHNLTSTITSTESTSLITTSKVASISWFYFNTSFFLIK